MLAPLPVLLNITGLDMGLGYAAICLGYGAVLVRPTWPTPLSVGVSLPLQAHPSGRGSPSGLPVEVSEVPLFDRPRHASDFFGSHVALTSPGRGTPLEMLLVHLPITAGLRLTKRVSPRSILCSLNSDTSWA